MNKADRRKLKDLSNSLETIQVAIDELKDDLEERLDNLQEHFSGGPAIDDLEIEITSLEETVDLLVEAIATLDGVID